MVVSSIPSTLPETTGQLTANTSAAATTAQQAPAANANDATASPAPADTVTLSPQAQQTLTTSNMAAAASSDPRAQQFYSLAAIITDTSGRYSQEDQLSAFVKFMAMPSNGGWPTSLSDFESVVKQVDNSAMGQLVNQLNRQVNSAAAAAFQMGNPNNNPPVIKATLKSFNSLSAFDQKVFFETSVNEQLPVGGSHYSSISQYTDFLESEAGGGESATVSTSATAAPASAPDTAATPGAATADGVPTKSAALQLVDSGTAFAQGLLKILTDANAAYAKQAASGADANDGNEQQTTGTTRIGYNANRGGAGTQASA